MIQLGRISINLLDFIEGYMIRLPVYFYHYHLEPIVESGGRQRGGRCQHGPGHCVTYIIWRTFEMESDHPRAASAISGVLHMSCVHVYYF